MIFGPWEAGPPPSRLRSPRDDVVTYRLRIDLDRTKPPLWRRLEVASDLFLDELHWIIQVAFGWDNGHLHEFSSGREGIPEEEVRLDEVLVDRGDKLYYEYDFGNGWQHTIQLEALLPRTDAEDSGGVYSYEAG